MSLGDFPLLAPIDCWVTTRFKGTPTTLVGGVVSIYKNTSTTPSTAGVTLLTDFASAVGQHQIHIDPSADPTFYSAGSFAIWFTAGTVGGQSAVSVIDTFTIGQVPTAAQIADAYLDRTNGIEPGLTPREAHRLLVAAVLAKASGMDANAPVFRDFNDTKDRLTAETDEFGNRLAVTYDPS